MTDAGTYVYYLGSDVDVYMTTESTDTENGSVLVDRATGVVSAGASDNENTFIPRLGAVVPTGAKLIENIELLEIEDGKRHQDSSPLGRHTSDKIYLGDKCTITATINMADERWRYIFKQADNGIDGEGNLNLSNGPTTIETGYRLYLKTTKVEGGATYTIYDTYCNCRMVDCKRGTPSQEMQTLQIVFEGILVKSQPTAYTNATAQDDL